MCSYSLRQAVKIALAVPIGIAGATVMSDAAAYRFGVWGIPFALAIASVSIVLYGLLAQYRERIRARVLRGMIALVFAADVASLVAPRLIADLAAVVAFWRRWSLIAHFIAILIVVFEADAFLNKKPER